MQRRGSWYSVGRFFHMRAVAAVTVVALSVGCAGSGAGREVSDVDGGWWGKTFTSTAILEDGRARSLEPGTAIELVFEERDGRRILRWNAGCNTWGAPVTIGAEHLELGVGSQSASGCSDALERQDAWLQEFFRVDPAWRRGDDVLRLTVDNTVIEFEDTTDEEIAPTLAFISEWYGPDGKLAERGRGEHRA